MKETIKNFINIVLIKEWGKARTVFTAMFYGVFLFMIMKKLPVPPELNTIISTLFGYWFGQKQSTKKPTDEQTK